MEFTNLKKCLENLVHEYNTPGVDCTVYKEHTPIFRYFYGLSDRENNIPMNGKELYYIFSMSKMLTCTCALQLFEKGKFSMDDPVAKYLPAFSKMKISHGDLNSRDSLKVLTGAGVEENGNSSSDVFAKNSITIKNLFTMTAGLDYNIAAPYVTDAIAQGKVHTKELVETFANTILWFEPGERFKYSLCHDVLGALIEVWSGMTFGEYMKKNLLEPLKMKNTFFGSPKDKETLSKMAPLYSWENPTHTATESKEPERVPLSCRFNLTEEYESGGAGLVSCLEDYAVFLDALANGGMGHNGKRILQPATVELMKTNQLSGKALEDFYELRYGYGYGMGVRTHIDNTVSGSLSPIGEFGWDGAAGAFSLVDTENKISLTYFQHVLGWDLKIQDEIRNALYNDLKSQN